MWIILGFFISSSIFALESFDKIPGIKILRVLENNIILINRGAEDGIEVNQHGHLALDSGAHVARGICIRTKSDISYWKLYRIPYAEAISIGQSYQLSGLADKEIPYPQAKIIGKNIPINDPEDIKRNQDSTDPFAVKSDMPEELSERDLIDNFDVQKRQLIYMKEVRREQFYRDMKNYRFSLYASPFARQSINNGESLRYGLRAENLASKFRLQTQLEQQQTRLKDPLTKEEVSTRNTQGQVSFVVNRLSKNFSSLSLINYDSTYFSKPGTPQSHWKVGPLGFTWHLFENKKWEYFDLSYIPLFDARATQVINGSGSTRLIETNGLRHGLRLALKTKINERVALENLLWVRPYQSLSTWEVDPEDLNLVNDLKLVFSITDNLFFDYNFIYQKDKIWKTLSNLPETNTINSINFRYDFNL
jgi:hypothetical protein